VTTQATGGRRTDKAQYGLAAVLAVVGVWTIIDARGLNVGFGDPIGPRVFPYVIGGVMLVLAVVLALVTARGDVPEAEAGEDFEQFLDEQDTRVSDTLEGLGLL